MRPEVESGERRRGQVVHPALRRSDVPLGSLGRGVAEERLHLGDMCTVLCQPGGTGRPEIVKVDRPPDSLARSGLPPSLMVTAGDRAVPDDLADVEVLAKPLVIADLLEWVGRRLAPSAPS